MYLIFLYWPDKGHHSRPRMFVYGPCPVAVDTTPITTVIFYHCTTECRSSDNKAEKRHCVQNTFREPPILP
ncbi:hypothetical protein Y032_0077g1120 [Ancylostoma ceylanicum]|uniref:Uncharacterized protein n=1 Tax=Ancylostoma ceylanicum TaxID=53326 RepID=A0A016TU48_9BILA|nr:hypothetical protein Y032_0077g1120 [Ancylostoma ceylanicum]